MAKFVKLTHTIVVTDGGAEVVNTQKDLETEVDEYIRSTARVDNGGSITFCVRGTDVAGIIDPFVLPLSLIRGYSIRTDAPLGIREDGAVNAVERGAGTFGPDICALNTLELENAGALPANIEFLIWGDR